MGLYLLQFALALIIGIQIFEVLEASFGQSMIVDEMMTGFNYTILMDFINVHGASLSPLIGLLRWVVLLYLVISSFVHAGLIQRIIDSTESFWGGASKFFFESFCIGAIAVAALLLFSALLWLPILTQLFPLIESFSSEKPIVLLLIVMFVFWFLGVSLLFTWSVKSRFLLISGHRASSWIAMRTAAQGLWRDWIALFPTLLFLAIAYFLLYVIVFWLEISVGIKSMGLIFLFFILHQIVLLCKVFLGVVSYLVIWHRVQRY